MAVYEKYFKENKGRAFPIYAYSPPHEGKYWVDDTIYPTEDFRTVERYKEYKECGFNLLFMQRTAPYCGEEWESSQTKLAMERAVEAGLEKIIIVDERIFDLSKIADGLIGEGKKFACESELDSYISDCIKDYRHQKGFYGVQIIDEPFHPYLKSVGQIFKSVKRVDESIFVHCNLNPLILPTIAFRICPEGRNIKERYEKYLTMFLDESDADYVMVDVYPFHKTQDKSNFDKYYYACLEIIAKVCKERKKEMHMVMQSFGMNIDGKPHHRLPNKQEFELQKNTLIAFGVKEFSYFTYWTKQANKTYGESFPDGMAMMTRHGEKTKAYYHVQKINEELNALVPLLWDFEYQSNAFFSTPPLFTKPVALEMVSGGDISQISSVEVEKETVLVTQLYDKKRKQYLHCVINATNPPLYRKKYKMEKQHTCLTYDKKYTHADIYFKGKWKTVELTEGKLTIDLYSGDGVLILPYNK